MSVKRVPRLDSAIRSRFGHRDSSRFNPEFSIARILVIKSRRSIEAVAWSGGRRPPARLSPGSRWLPSLDASDVEELGDAAGDRCRSARRRFDVRNDAVVTEVTRPCWTVCRCAWADSEIASLALAPLTLTLWFETTASRKCWRSPNGVLLPVELR